MQEQVNRPKSIMFAIEGEPMGKQRPRVAVMGKSRFAHAYTPKETINYESKVVFAYKEEMKLIGKDPFQMLFDSPNTEIHCVIDAYYQIPKSHYRFYKRENCTRLDKQGEEMSADLIHPTKKPDCDIAKIILDALNGIAFHDDGQVVYLTVRKHYAESPRVDVYLTEAYSNGY